MIDDQLKKVKKKIADLAVMEFLTIKAAYSVTMNIFRKILFSF